MSFLLPLLAVTAMHSESKFAKAYADGVRKTEYWEYMLEDSFDLIAKLPVVAAMIYRNVFKDGVIGMCILYSYYIYRLHCEEFPLG